MGGCESMYPVLNDGAVVPKCDVLPQKFQDGGDAGKCHYTLQQSAADVKPRGRQAKAREFGSKERRSQEIEVEVVQRPTKSPSLESSVGDQVDVKSPGSERSRGSVGSLGEDSQPCILHPYSSWRSAWDFTGLFMVLYDVASIPFMFFEPSREGFLDAMAWITRIFWTSDVPASFLTGYVLKNGNIEMRPTQIWRRYFQSWFWLDLFIIGLDWGELVLDNDVMQIAGFGRASRVVRVMRLMRLLRLARMGEVIASITERLNSDRLIIFIDIVKIMGVIMAIAHLNACIWYLISDTVNTGLSGEDTWLAHYDFDAASGSTISERYCMSMHWALTQFAGGMDEITARNIQERIFAMIVFTLTFLIAAAFLSSLTSSMTQLYLISSHQTQQYAILRRYLAQSGISKSLAIRVRRNATHAVEENQRNMSEDSVEMLKFVSDPLRMELHFELFKDEISVHPFFRQFVAEGPQVMGHVCHRALQFSLIASGDTIFDVGECPQNPKMFFLCRGTLEYISSGKHTLIQADDWLSEAALWTLAPMR